MVLISGRRSIIFLHQFLPSPLFLSLGVSPAHLSLYSSSRISRTAAKSLSVVAGDAKDEEDSGDNSRVLSGIFLI